MSCAYRDIFGKPNEGVHSIRLFNIAIVDLALTVAAAVAISKYWWRGKHFLVILGILLLSGIVAHWLFCVNTTLNKAIFGPV